MSGGCEHTASGIYASVTSGQAHRADGNWSSVAGGQGRVATSSHDWRAGELFQEQ